MHWVAFWAAQNNFILQNYNIVAVLRILNLHLIVLLVIAPQMFWRSTGSVTFDMFLPNTFVSTNGGG